MSKKDTPPVRLATVDGVQQIDIEEYIAQRSDPNLVRLNVHTRHRLEPNYLLSEAFNRLKDCVIVGYDNDGEEFFASSLPDAADANWLLDMGKKRLSDIVDELEEEKKDR